jgi:hypothetical protein
MRISHAALLLAVSASPALAQRAPVIVMPGRPDVPVLLSGVLPVYMNGVDASWSVIEGEFGLDRPGEMTPTVIYQLPPRLIPYSRGVAYEPGYFPHSGERPGYGRLEVLPGPNRPRPPAAPSFRQGWSSQSAPTPVTVYPPFTTPPIVVAPGGGPDWHQWRRGAPQDSRTMQRGNE